MLFIKYLLLFLILFSFNVNLFAQDLENDVQRFKNDRSHFDDLVDASKETQNKHIKQEKYVKKTIARPNKVYSFNQATRLSKTDQEIALNYFDKAFKTNRFYNTDIPTSMLINFDTSLDLYESISPEIIIHNLNIYLAEPIIEFLNTDSIQENRLTKQVENNTLSLVSSKGKSLDITADDLKKFMNSSFFYFPYVDNITFSKKILKKKIYKKSEKTVSLPSAQKNIINDSLNKKVSNPSLKTQMTLTPSFSDPIDLLFDTFSRIGQSNNDLVDKDKDKDEEDEDDFKIVKIKKLSYIISGGVLWFQLNVDPSGKYHFEKIAHLPMSTSRSKVLDIDDAEESTLSNLKHGTWSGFANSLSFQSSLLSAFRIQGNIMNQDKHFYDLDIDSSIGIKIDDYYLGMENFETEDGYKSEQVSLLRITKPSMSSNLSRAAHQFGSLSAMPSWVIEDPRYHIEAALGFSSLSGLSITPYAPYNAELALLNQKLANNLYFYYNVQTNIGRFIDISQLFFTIDGHYTYLNDTTNVSTSSYVTSVYLGITKKYWYKSFNFALSYGFGQNYIDYISPQDSFDYFESSNIAHKIGISAEKLITNTTSIGGEYLFSKALFSPLITTSFDDHQMFFKIDDYTNLDFSSLSIYVRMYL
ncbi:MAG: hypothetical protein CMP39_01620 [Rickettsiales bacterium]|nr:hypothetical protein [Rickettsiales bacterium]|tara:strand:- start:5556 stop:7481 length:1926 start_codon:yes stop_codon:yes gene_type:complete